MSGEQQHEESQARIKALETGRLRDKVAQEAQAQGLIDPKDLDHIAFEGVEMHPDGTITGATEFVEKLKSSKGHWFKQDNHSSNGDRDRFGRPIPKMADVSKIKPGSPEHKELERKYREKWS